jgi:uncharacterized membrane protein YgdD (TMEM256/DUF423 family)
MPDQPLVAVAALLAGTAVAAGALAAHGIADPTAVRLVETASRYQMWHALAMLALAAMPLRAEAAGWGFALGVVLFSGSLYGLALGAPRWLAWLTPLGGLTLIGSWAAVAIAARRKP